MTSKNDRESYPIKDVDIQVLINDGVLKLRRNLEIRTSKLEAEKAILTHGDAEGSMNANDAATVMGSKKNSGLIFRASACLKESFRIS